MIAMDTIHQCLSVLDRIYLLIFLMKTWTCWIGNQFTSHLCVEKDGCKIVVMAFTMTVELNTSPIYHKNVSSNLDGLWDRNTNPAASTKSEA